VYLLPFGFTLSFLIAHKLYPVRIRVINVAGKPEWLVVAYIPVVRTLQEKSAAERGSQRRCGVMQRVLYAAFREFISFSHLGFKVRLDTRVVKVFPRTLLYLCDRPEERAVLSQKGGQCEHPCSVCDVTLAVSCLPEAKESMGRVVVDTLDDQIEGMEHLRRARKKRRRRTLASVSSASNYAPVFGGMAGLGTEPYLLYHMIGFDILHVRCESTLTLTHDA